MINSEFREKFLDSRIYSSSDGAAFLRQISADDTSLTNSTHLQQWLYAE
jgi:hypothetical protein